MRVEVRRDLGDSAHDFLRVVWPAVSKIVGGGDLRPVEAVASKGFQADLDQLAGIDAWQVVQGKGIRGISSRIQWIAPGKPVFRTFTIRKSRRSGAKTEWDKRIEGIANRQAGFIAPHLLVHAYIQTPRRAGRLLYVAVCRVDDLFDFASENHRGTVWIERSAPDGNTFAAFRVDALRRKGVKIRAVDLTSSQSQPALPLGVAQEAAE